MPPKQSSKKIKKEKSNNKTATSVVSLVANPSLEVPVPSTEVAVLNTEPPVNTPVVSPTNLSLETVSTLHEDASDIKNNVRKQLSKAIGIELPISRIRKRLDAQGINSVYTKACKEIREATEYSAETRVLYNEANRALSEKDNKVEPSVDDCIEYINKKRFRFSSDAAVAMSTILDYLLRQVMSSSIKYSQEKSESKVTWYVEEKSVARCLLRSSQEADESTSDFYYINNMYKLLKGTDASPRITNEFRTSCSDLVACVIKRFVPLVVMFANASKLKTINENTIVFVLKFVITDAGGDYSEIKAYVQEKVALFKSM